MSCTSPVGRHNICRFDTSGNYLGQFSHPDLTGPQGIAFDERGHLFSSSFYQHKLVEFDASLNYVQTVTAGALQVPRSVAFASGVTATPATGPLVIGALALAILGLGVRTLRKR